MPAGCSTPATSRNVGATSMRFTMSSATRPAGIVPGSRAASATSQPMS